MVASHLLAIDQGTTSTRAFLFDAALSPVGFAQLEFPQIFPSPGWVEHDPQGIWTTSVATARAARHTKPGENHIVGGPGAGKADPHRDLRAGPAPAGGVRGPRTRRAREA